METKRKAVCGLEVEQKEEKSASAGCGLLYVISPTSWWAVRYQQSHNSSCTGCFEQWWAPASFGCMSCRPLVHIRRSWREASRVVSQTVSSDVGKELPDVRRKGEHKCLIVVPGAGDSPHRDWISPCTPDGLRRDTSHTFISFRNFRTIKVGLLCFDLCGG